MKIIATLFLLFPSAVFAAGTNDLPALLPAYPEIPPTFWEQHKVAVILGGFLFIVVQSLWLYKLLMRLQPKVEPPENLARAALTRLLDEPEDGRGLSEISGAVRRYFGVVFGTPGDEATTAEFVSGLARNEKITPELKARLASFLQACDARKFSPAKSAAPLDAAENALDLVNEAENIRVKHNAGKA